MTSISHKIWVIQYDSFWYFEETHRKNIYIFTKMLFLRRRNLEGPQRPRKFADEKLAIRYWYTDEMDF